MKIIFIIEDITGTGGTERALINLSNKLTEYNYEIEIHSLYQYRNADTHYKISNIVNLISHDLSHYKKKNIFNTPLFVIRRYSKVKFILRNHQADFIIGLWSDINCILAYYRKLNPAKKIGCEHISYNFPKSPFWNIIRKKIFNKLDYVIVLTQHDKKIYNTFCKNVIVIPNSLSFYPENHCDKNSKIILSIGRLTSQKGFDSLIKACSGVFKEYPEWSLKIIGEGPDKDKLVSLIKANDLENNISINNITPNILNEYLSSSIYVLSSKNEGFPMVLLEAMACGLAVVSFDCPTGPAEIINHNTDGILVENQNIEMLTQSIIRVISDPKLRKELSSNARINILRYHSDSVIKDWLDILS